MSTIDFCLIWRSGATNSRFTAGTGIRFQRFFPNLRIDFQFNIMTDIGIVKFGRFKERFSAGENIFKSVVENILFRFDDGIFVRVVESGHAYVSIPIAQIF